MDRITRSIGKGTLMLALGLLTGACSVTCGGNQGEARVAEGPLSSWDAQLPAFHGIEAGSAFRVTVHVGESQRVTLAAPADVRDHVEARVRDNVLELGLKGGPVTLHGPLEAEIWLPELRSLDLSGAANASVAGLRGKDLVLDLSGASDLRLDGEVARLEADLSGASELDAGDCPARAARLSLSGASEATVDVQEDLEAECSGASELAVWGKPARNVVNSSGASEVRNLGRRVD
jgi:hypothetical protein